MSGRNGESKVSFYGPLFEIYFFLNSLQNVHHFTVCESQGIIRVIIDADVFIFLILWFNSQ